MWNDKILDDGSLEIDIGVALCSLRPGAQWALGGDNYVDLKWLDSAQQKPTEEEINNEIARLVQAREDNSYRNKRKKEYPPLEDVIVALAEREEGRPEMWESVAALRESVRNKYPKL